MYWKKELKRGKQFLADKELVKAMRCFESAVDNCPVTSSAGLEKSLFFLGITLKKLGRTDSAMRCWHLGRKIRNEGRSRQMISIHSNRYGMYRNGDSDQVEDEKAFFGLQLERYFKTKKAKRFCSEAERDVILDIIGAYWSELQADGNFHQLSIDEKIRFFRNQPVIFPVADISSLNNDSSGEIIYTDFKKGELQSMDDLCSCGSGMLFSQCCGRIKSSVELDSGKF
ncbi:SEC-C metal-binding domain-containing protein [Spirochaeta isovalerica]|uniref:SEC-C motif domain protein n=1 Tax=Spirochaeta isovalerica TaxID=150 RepID=A0A841R721_9SPIO|nr:SEC-C metal-binding domain-containing protein [Spirochaeta isovalerica]MBB6478779.1 hypothetical protein [Spirochaeta isovalerica]